MQDCAGTWGGSLVDDECGCVAASNSGDDCDDCTGVPNGSNVIDNCGTCDSDSSNDCVQDCAGTWGGSSIDDQCGVCGGDNTSCADCAGLPNGANLEDNCGVCDSNILNDCVQDCAGTWGGSLVDDECGVCGGDNTSCGDCVQDCAGTWGGNAFVDNCYDSILNSVIYNECSSSNTPGCDCAPPYVYDYSGDCAQFYAPIIREIKDIPNDQGLSIVLDYQGSIYDHLDYAEDINITHYSFWRLGDVTPNNRIPGWEKVAETDAGNLQDYSKTLPTIVDSSANGLYYSTFMVRAHTDDGVYFQSEPDSGYSWDNLAPYTPPNFSAELFNTYNIPF